MRRTEVCAFFMALALPLAAAGQEAPGTFKIPFTDSTLRLYGYVQLDFTADISGRIGDINNYDYATLLPVQPLDGTPNAEEEGKLYFTARTSRVGIETNTPTGWGPVGVKLEADFNAPNGFQGETYTNSMLFRLRHAYGTIGGLLIGQTWSTFLDLASAPDTVDYNGPGSLANIRQPQVRYTLGVAPGTTFTVAAENPRTSGIGHIPDFVAKIATGGKWGTFALAGVTTQHRFNDSSPKQGFGGALSGSLKLGSDTLVAHVVAGEGLGRYVLNAAVNGAGDDDGERKLWRTLAYHVGFTHVWSPRFRSNVVWSQTFFRSNGIDNTVTFDDEDGTADSGPFFVPNKRLDQAFVNTFWSVAKNAEFGLEYEFGRRETVEGQIGRQNRITAIAHYNFF